MKTQMLPVIWLLSALALFSVPRPASAYYDPGVQRRINRDPIHEAGFLALGAIKPGWAQEAESNLHAFVGNSPLRFFDPKGLWQVCCRPVRGGLGVVLTHCDVREGPCDPDPSGTSYPITFDCNCKNKDIKSEADMSACLKKNRTAPGRGCWGDNCQSSSREALKDCCGKSGWKPSPYAYPIVTDPQTWPPLVN